MPKKNGIDPDKFIRRAVDRYDGEILHNDANLESLVAKLKALGVLDNTLIIVVSDHGEEFWDHGWTAHGHSLYQELTHCVFLMWNPKLLGSARRVSEPVQLIDVMPTRARFAEREGAGHRAGPESRAADQRSVRSIDALR